MPDKAPQKPSQPEKDGPWERFLDWLAANLLWLTGLRRRTKVLAALALVLVCAGIGGLIAYENLKRPSDVTNSDAAFNPDETAQKREHTVNWPLYGYDLRRSRYLPVKGIKPPFKRLWSYGAKPLLEFPPIFVDGVLYALDNSGHAFAIKARSGKVLWKRRVAQLNASAPTYSHHRLFIVNLTPGQVLALNPSNGHTEWRKRLPGRSESSPVVVGERVFFGDEDGTMYAVDRRNGRTIWTTQLCGAIKAAPAYQHGILFVGDYGGCMNAVNAHTGKVKWQSSSQGLGFGTTGAFYSTPAVAFGRVYSGNNDHRVYSYAADDGTLAWSHSTGDQVYSGPTVADTPNTPPTVYIGSLDGSIYALDAKSGDTRWSRSAGGPVIGSLSAVGNIVYVASYSPKQTNGFLMKSGRQVFHYGTGAYMPVISDGHRIYLTGYSSITGLQPLTKRQIQGRAKARREKAARQAKHRRAQAKARAEHRRDAAAAKRKQSGNGAKQKPPAKQKPAAKQSGKKKSP
jgi:outer membrane protein assembly factor BamB